MGGHSWAEQRLELYEKEGERVSLVSTLQRLLLLNGALFLLRLRTELDKLRLPVIKKKNQQHIQMIQI